MAAARSTGRGSPLRGCRRQAARAAPRAVSDLRRAAPRGAHCRGRGRKRRSAAKGLEGPFADRHRASTGGFSRGGTGHDSVHRVAGGEERLVAAGRGRDAVPAQGQLVSHARFRRELERLHRREDHCPREDAAVCDIRRNPHRRRCGLQTPLLRERRSLRVGAGRLCRRVVRAVHAPLPEAHRTRRRLRGERLLPASW